MSGQQCDIYGVTALSLLDDSPPHYFAEVCAADRLCIAHTDPDIETLKAVKVQMDIRSFRHIPSCTGAKVLVQGIRHISLAVWCGSIQYDTEFCRPFAAVIPLSGCQERVRRVKVIVEAIEVCLLNPRSVAVTTLAVLVPEFAVHRREQDRHSVRCDIQLYGRQRGQTQAGRE